MSFSKLFASYKTYQPEVEGYGDPKEWAKRFTERMGFEEAEAIIHAQDESPRGILGVSPKATWMDIKRAYRSMAMLYHPDQCIHTGLSLQEAEAKFKKLQAAYSVLARQHGL
jgi:DnaJ like chaperone protein